LKSAKLGDEGIHEEEYSNLSDSNTFIHGPWFLFRQHRQSSHQPEAIAGVELLEATALLASFRLGLRGDELVIHFFFGLTPRFTSPHLPHDFFSPRVRCW